MNLQKKNERWKKFLNKKRKIQKKSKSKEESIEAVVAKYEEFVKVNTSTLQSFSDMPLSKATLQGLEDSEFEKPTEIQAASLPFSLTGSDVVGAAKTGSGKTLALVIPLLECLWREKWSSEYGLGALVISPTRELALQTFNTLNSVGRHHKFSCALLIGGTDVEFERKRLASVNILICTPGRLLQHMDENEQLTCDDLQMLIIDEADRILDMGFKKQVNAIVSNLPTARQTLLFSATQTKDVKELSRVCSENAVFVSVHENAKIVTPERLKQWYMVCDEQDKINTVWSFIINNRKQKSLIFVSSCKQARFLTEAFSHLRPGISLMGLWGTMNQKKRIDVFETFEKRQAAVLIATDVASRGLDFTNLDWVIQMDCPATIEDYIHRVGRTARMGKSGQSVMILTPHQEDPMLKLMTAKNIPLEKQIVDQSLLVDIRTNLRSVIAEFTELKEFAQGSIVSYLRALWTMPNKSLFEVEKVNAAELADSYGLVSVPRIRFLAKKGIKLEGTQQANKEKNDRDTEETTNKKNKLDKKTDDETAKGEKLAKAKKNEDDIKSLINRFAEAPAQSEEDVDLFTVKKRDVFDVKGENKEEQESLVLPGGAVATTRPRKEKVITRTQLAKKYINKNINLNTRIAFDDDETIQGEEKIKKKESTINMKTDGFGETEEVQENGQLESLESTSFDIASAKRELKTTDKQARKRMRDLRARKRAEKLEKRKKKKQEEDEVLDLGGGEESEGEEPDLSWLPDPDEVRRRYAEEEEEHDATDTIEQMEEETIKECRKRKKRASISIDSTKVEKKSKNSEAREKSGKRRKNELADAEKIALQLLGE